MRGFAQQYKRVQRMAATPIRKVNKINLSIAIALSLVCLCMYAWGVLQYSDLQEANSKYVACEKAADQMQEGSDYLTAQARTAAATGKIEYVRAYYEEVNTTKRREAAVQTFRDCFDNSATLALLESSLEESNELMFIEAYAMRLKLEAAGVSESKWPAEIKSVKLSAADKALSKSAKSDRAVELLYDDSYENARSLIASHITRATGTLVSQSQSAQESAAAVFKGAYLALIIAIVGFVILTIATALMMRDLIVRPLESHSRAVEKGELFEICGAGELRHLASVYNKIFQENEERQMLIRHQAEHDALTDLLNRGSYDRLLSLYEKEGAQFALILCDVDTFKQVNDVYGHEVGDQILKRVASMLKVTFRTIDHVCRIGGDEFAVIMVEMTSDLRYTIEEKIAVLNSQLLQPTESLPGVSLSVGVAFADRENPGAGVYQDADKALYCTKENGRCGVSFYGDGDLPAG